MANVVIEIIAKGADEAKGQLSDLTGTFNKIGEALHKNLGEPFANIKKGIESAGEGIKKFLSDGDKIAAIGGAIGAVAGAGIAKLSLFAAESVVHTIQLADSMNTLSQRTGIAVEALSGLKFAAEQSDTSLGAVAHSMGQLMRTLGDESSKNAKALRELGITAKEPIEALMQVAEAVRRTEDPMKQAAIAQLAFGRGWREVMPLLKEGAVGLGELMDAGRKYYPLTQELAQQADKYNDSLKELGAAFESLKIQIGVKAIPALTDIASAMAGATREEGLLRGALVGLGGVMVKAWGPVKEVWDALAWGLQQIVTWPVKKAGEYLKAAQSWAAELIKALRDRINDFVDIGVQMIAGLGDGIRKKWNELKSWFSGLVSEIPAWAKKALDIRSPSGEFRKIGEAVADGFKLGVLNKEPEVQQSIRKMVKKAKSDLDEIFRENRRIERRNLENEFAIEAARLDEWARNIELVKQNLADLVRTTEPNVAALESFNEVLDTTWKAMDLGIISMETYLYYTEKLALGTNKVKAQNLPDEFLSFVYSIDEAARATAEFTAKMDYLHEKAMSGAITFEYYDYLVNKVATSTKKLETETTRKMSDMERAVKRFSESASEALVNFAIRGKSSFSDMIRSWIADIAKLTMKKKLEPMFDTLLSAAFSFFNVKGFATGGVFTSPTVFQYGGGIGVMGERGPEAVMPLTRLPDGSLGVKATGGGIVIEQTINVDARGADAGAVGRLEAAVATLAKAIKPAAVMAVREAMIRNRVSPAI